MRNSPILRGEGRVVHGLAGVLARAVRGALAGALLLAAAACGPDGPPQSPTLRVSLDGGWLVQLDPEDRGLAEDWVSALTAGARPEGAAGEPFVMTVPGPLEGAPQTALTDLGTMRGYDGVAWYVRRFRAPDAVEGARIALRLERVNYAGRVFLDGVVVGEHEGGYGPAQFDLTGRLVPGDEHVLVVRVVDPGAEPVDGLTLSTTPHGKESWYHNFGGLLGSVRLDVHTAPAITSLSVLPDDGGGEVWVTVAVAAPVGEGRAPDDVPVELLLDDGTRTRFRVALSDGTGAAARKLQVAEPERWSPESPRLYTLESRIDGRPGPVERFGFRRVELRDGDLFLNGERRVLHGVLYQPHVPGLGGVDPDPAFLREEVEGILDTGFDLVRVHVAPAPEAFLDACDELGLLVLAEPAIGWLDDDPLLLPRLRDEIGWMVARDRHHPSLVMWGVLNEMSGRAYVHVDALASELAALDPSRPVLEDSGGFLGGGRYREPVTGRRLPMTDVHLYPPYPLPPEWRAEMATAGADTDGPVFVSEFGYGSMLDAGRARDGYVSRGLFGEERALFEGFADRQRRAQEADGPWNEVDWLARADEVSADAAEDMVEALRGNPALDLLGYTQWRAVSSEASAGVLAPWGEPRRVRARLARALRPLLTTVNLPEPSVRRGRDTEAEVVVVNDTGATVSARLLLRAEPAGDDGSGDDGASDDGSGDDGAGVEVDWGRHDFEPGPTAFTAPLFLELGDDDAPRPDGDWTVTAVLAGDEGVLDVSTPRRLVVVPPAPDERLEPRSGRPLKVWSPRHDEEVVAFTHRQGLVYQMGQTLADVALLTDPGSQVDGTGFGQLGFGQLGLWSWVWHGGVVVVLLPEAGRNALGPAGSQRRSVDILHRLPGAPLARPAAGHFMGRFHLRSRTVDGGAPLHLGVDGISEVLEMLGRGDEVVAPRTLLWGAPGPDATAASVTLDHLGGVIGTSHVRLPFGDGFVELVGAPLLERLGAQVDPRRDRLLADVLVAAAAAGDGQAAYRGVSGWSLTPAERDAWNLLARRVGRLADLGSRASAFSPRRRGELVLPPLLADALARKDAALRTLLAGDGETFLRDALALLAELDAASLDDFIAREASVLAALRAAVAAPSPENAPAAHEALERWVLAVSRAFAGDRDGADAALAEAARLLGASAPGPPR